MPQSTDLDLIINIDINSQLQFTMDRVAVLSRSSHVDRADLTSSAVQRVLAPTLTHFVQAQRALSALSLSLLLHAWLATRMALWAGRLCVVQAWLATSMGVALSAKMAFATWDSRRARALRKRVERDFACFILGTGNGIFLMLFWPGWWILAGTLLALSQLRG